MDDTWKLMRRVRATHEEMGRERRGAMCGERRGERRGVTGRATERDPVARDERRWTRPKNS